MPSITRTQKKIILLIQSGGELRYYPPDEILAKKGNAVLVKPGSKTIRVHLKTLDELIRSRYVRIKKGLIFYYYPLTKKGSDV